MGSMMPSQIMVEPRPVPSEQEHIAAFAPPQRVHLCVVDHFDGALERGFEIRPARG
jgi:hypothetical protein